MEIGVVSMGLLLELKIVVDVHGTSGVEGMDDMMGAGCI